MGNRLLLADGDPRDLRVLDVGLRSAGFSVDTASNGTDAWARLVAAPPDLIIADAALEGIDGFELCARVRQSAPTATIPFIILVADQTLEKKLRSLEAGADDYLVKPAYIQEVLARVRERLKRRQRDRLTFVGQDGQSGPVQGDVFRGDLNDITIVDLLQIMEANARSGIAHVRGDDGTVTGAIFFRNGGVVDAEVGRLSGLDALSRLFAWTRGTFDLEWRSIRRKDVIQRPVAELVIEGMQRVGERHRLKETLAAAHTIFEVNYKLLAERLAAIPDKLNEILRLCDGVRSMEQVIEETGMPDVEALTALTRLRDEGIIYNIAHGLGLRVSPPREDPSASSWAAASASSPPGPSTAADPPTSPAPPRRRTAPGLGGGLDVTPAARSPNDEAATSATDEGIPEVREEPAHAAAFLPATPMLRTQRGFAVPVSAEPGSDSAIPRVVVEGGRGDSAPPIDGVGASGRQEAVEPIASPVHRPREGVPMEVLSAPGSGTVSSQTSQATEATVRVSFADNDISTHEALDELGLPSRWRALRFLAVAVVFGGLAAVVVHRFRDGRGDKSETTTRGGQPDATSSVPVASVPVAMRAEPTLGGVADAAQPPVGGALAEQAPAVASVAVAEQRGDGGIPGTTAVDVPPPVATPPAAQSEEGAGVPSPVTGGAPTSGSAEPRPRAPSEEEASAGFSRQLADCRTAFARNHLRDAFEACSAAVAANPRSAEALTLLARTELNRGRLSRAADLATRAIAADPNVADAYVIMGGVRQDSGQNAEAKAAYRRYLELAPHGRYADDLRSIVNGL